MQEITFKDINKLKVDVKDFPYSKVIPYVKYKWDAGEYNKEFTDIENWLYNNVGNEPIGAAMGGTDVMYCYKFEYEPRFGMRYYFKNLEHFVMFLMLCPFKGNLSR